MNIKHLFFSHFRQKGTTVDGRLSCDLSHSILISIAFIFAQRPAAKGHLLFGGHRDGVSHDVSSWNVIASIWFRINKIMED